MKAMKLVVAVTGASGAKLAIHVLDALREHGVEIHLVLSEGARKMAVAEAGVAPEEFVKRGDFVYSESQLDACISSGSFVTDGMIVVPCSMKTLSGIANAYDENLVIRAADVCLKERRRVVLVPREMPLNRAHLRNMLTAAEDGCVIIPPMLSFYAGCEDLESQLDQITGKILMHFGLDYAKMHVWNG